MSYQPFTGNWLLRRRVSLPTDSFAFSTTLIVFGIAALLTFGWGQVSDAAFRLGATPAQGELIDTEPVHPRLLGKLVPLYGFEDAQGIGHVAVGTRTRAPGEAFPAVATVLYRANDPLEHRVIGLYDDQRRGVLIGAAMILGGIMIRRLGRWRRLRRERAEAAEQA
jgi:hypothetical protein